MGLGVGGRGEAKLERRGREGKERGACLRVLFEQAAMVLRAETGGRRAQGGVFLSSDIRDRKGKEGNPCLSVELWVLESPGWCHLTHLTVAGDTGI